MASTPPRRNDPCPCGSGKRYKECHGSLAASPPPAPSVDQVLERAQAAHQQGRLPEAEAGYRSVLGREPGHAIALHYLGLVHWQRRDLVQAEALVRRSLEAQPGIPQFWNNLGLVVRDAGHADEALAAFERARSLDPAYPDAVANLADSYLRRREPRRVVEIVESSPPTFEALFALGLAWQQLARYGRARDALLRARELLPAPLRALEAELGALQSERLRLDTQLVAEPGSAAVREARRALGARIVALRARMAATPAYSKPAWSLGTAAFQAGDLALGWRFHPWRSARGDFESVPGHPPGTYESFALPPRLDGMRVHVWREQGLGDTLFFLRYASRLRDRGAKPVYRGDARLFPMLARTGLFERFDDEQGPYGEADFILTAGDLPILLGRPELADLPPPLALVALPEAVERARSALRGHGAGPVLAATWRAGTRGDADLGVLSKEIDPAALGRALSRHPGPVASVQRLPTDEENRRFREGLGRDFIDLSSWNPDLEGVLAVMAVVDDYVGVSNTNMHLRTGLGRAACVLVPVPAEWRWPGDAAGSPWFPGFEVLHQDPEAGWAPVLARLEARTAAAAGLANAEAARL